MERMDDDFLASSILLSDMAVREEGTGKLSIIGSFQGFNAASLPFVSPRFFVVVAITNFVKTPKAFDVTARIEDPRTGHVVGSVSAHLQIKEGAIVPRNAYIEVPVPFPQVMFPSGGEYKVEILVYNISAGARYVAVNTQTTNPQLSA